ncbi:hypothetical protein [Ferrimonas lipolytica]|uniref:Uncharacterized protein n=1 Tax=Ferrimonas lipolytica TaxID=2724191 RepID=A0A6H1UD61_9GAMM|nr:hypothetical protein [Ferrimonas lipolytica]QIZ76146.1 hypothetical protein HER31_04110 [Ferrimonas lipolytica]
METRLLIVFAIFLSGNLYWCYRYLEVAKNTDISTQQREDMKESIQDNWVQFACIAIIITMLMAPVAHNILMTTQ